MTNADVTAGMAVRLSEALVALGRVRVELPALLAAWNTASPELGRDTSRHAALAATLEHLAATGRIQLPRGAWDHSTVPPLPNFVTVPSARKAPKERPWRDFPWCAEMAWAADLLSLRGSQFDDLTAVNRWLAAGGRTEPVTPVQVRSIQVFGHEKRLLELATGTTLFAEGRLSFELLRCRRYPPPLAHERVGPDGRWLIVENADSFWLARDAARATRTVDVVAWGAGRAAAQSILSLHEHHGAVDHLYYWGDIDPDGIEIATNVSDACRAAGLPDLRPAEALWTATARTGARDPGTMDWRATDLCWLDAAQPAVAAVATAKGRVPQEALDGPAIEAVLGQGL